MEVRSIGTSTELCGDVDFPYAAPVFTLRREVSEMVAQKSRSETAQGIGSLPALRHCARSDPPALRLIGLRL